MGISSVISFSVAIWNGEEFKEALKSSIYSGLKVGGIAWAGSILAAQLGRTGLEQALRGTTDYLVKSMGSKAYQFLSNGLSSTGTTLYGAAAITNLSKVLRGNIVTGIATTVVMSVPDFYRMFNGKMSGAQVFKNVATTGAGVAGGVGGYMGGAAAGAAIGSVVPVLGTAVGAIAGGLLGAFGGGSTASKVAQTLLDGFIEDDADEMMEIIEKVFGQLAFDYLLNEDEFKRAIAQFQKKDISTLLRNMYASNNKNNYALNKIEPIIENIAKERVVIKLPSNQEIIDNMGEVIEEILDGKTPKGTSNKSKQIAESSKIDVKKDFFDIRLSSMKSIKFLEDSLAYCKDNYPNIDIIGEMKKVRKYEKYLKDNGYWSGEHKNLVKKMKSCANQM